MENVVLVTGGAGTLGQAVVRGLLKDRGNKIVIYSRDEASQVKMATDVEFGQRVFYEIGDVTSRDALNRAFLRHKVTQVVHAAALKHVPVCEKQPSECIETNVIGSRNVLRSALECGVSSVVLVSTDKAAQPTNTYGLSKALMERLVCEFDGIKGMRVTATRFGNLVGSRGSVLELFLHQLKTTGMVTVTDPSMTRFFIRIRHAADTVLYALNRGTGNQVLVPAMRAATLGDFVKATIEFSRTNGKMNVVGLRPGEKHHEMIITEDEARRTVQPNEFHGVAITSSTQKKPALDKALSSDVASMMDQDELLGMISEIGQELASA